MSSEKEHDYSDFGDEAPGDNLLAQISVTALEQQQAEAKVAKKEEELAAAKADLKDIAERRLPELMELARQTEITTSDGIKVKLDEKIYASIPKAGAGVAFKWLEDNKHGDIIKRTFTIAFGKEEDKWADKFERDLKQRKKPLAVKREKKVHPQTLGALIREELEKGVPVPLETLGAHR
ncbi:hypothetical protein KAR91_01015, partial [Candidatus Pacearchaeota archaeon]|nr:hypothetical protein [Candidatus Pacearchaeota archaeon]